MTICDVCETEYNGKKRDDCPGCGSKLTRPRFVEDSIYLRRQTPFSVHLKEKYESRELKMGIKQFKPLDNPKESDARWPEISIKNSEELVKLLEALKKFKNDLGWKAKSELLENIKEKKEESEENEEESSLDEDLEELVNQYPSFLKEVLETVDFENLDDEDFELLKETIQNLNDTTLQAERKIKEQFSELLGKLTEQEDGYEKLSELLEEWHLLQVTSTSNIALKRLEFLETFEEMIHNDDVYEIRGDDSIHRALERNLWIIDEEYWLIQSDKSLKKFIQQEMEDEDKEDEYRRPDFVCATQGGELVIAEIKRPSHTLQREDLNQIEDYYHYADKYRGENFQEINCYLIGNKADEQTESSAENRRNIQILTYNDILSSARDRYREYLEVVEENDPDTR